MKKVDINKIKNLAKKRKEIEVAFSLISLAIITLMVWLLTKVDTFNIEDTTHDVILYGSIISIVLFAIIFLIMVLKLMKPKNILQNDLRMIYYRKTNKKTFEIPIIDIRRVRARVKSGKKSKKQFGVLIIRTKNRRYRIKNILDVENIKKEIETLHERLAAYNEGYKQAEIERLEKFGDSSNPL